MTRVLVAAGLLTALSAQPGWTQSADDCVPSALNIPEAKYPCVYPDRRATFRVIAPNAEKVRLRVGPGFDMQKGPDGIWGPGTKAFSDALNQAGVHTVYFESPGTAHEWLSWRAFNDFAPRLFK